MNLAHRITHVKYKYSKQAEATFMAQPIYSFLFACFSMSTKGQNFAKEQIGCKDDYYVQRM